MTDVYEKCSCGSRYKSKCEKDEDSLYINFRETLNGGFCADIDYESEAWQKVLSDWSEFEIQEK